MAPGFPTLKEAELAMGFNYLLHHGKPWVCYQKLSHGRMDRNQQLVANRVQCQAHL